MQKLGAFNTRVLAVAILLLLISGTTVGVQVCTYGSEKHCTWNPKTWAGCWLEILMDMGNCVMMFFISKMGDFILMNPEISVFNPYINDIISLLFPVYVIAIAITGIYVIFLSTEPEHRARAKLMLIRLIMGMAMVTVSMSIYQLLINLAHAITEQILASQGVIGGGGGGLAILSILIVVSVAFFYISAWILPVLAIIALISIVFRYFMVCLMAVLFPLTLFFYFFEFTKGMGKNLMKYTMMAIFTQPVQALMMAIMLVGLNNVEASGGGIMALLIGLGGLIMIIAAPLFMLGLMKWIGGAVAGAGMILAFKRPLFGAAMVITGGAGAGMGPEAFVAGGSAWILGHGYQKHGPQQQKTRKHRIKKVAKWVAGRKSVQRGVKAFKRTRAGRKVTSGMKTIRANVDSAGDSLYKFKQRVKAGWQRHKKAIGFSIFIPGYWAYAASKSRMGSKIGASIKATMANKRYAAAIAAINNAANPADVTSNVKKIAGDDAVRWLENKHRPGAAINLDEMKRDAEWLIRRDKAIRYDIKNVKTFKELERLNKEFGFWSDKEFRNMREKAGKSQDKDRWEKKDKYKWKDEDRYTFENATEKRLEDATEHVGEEVRKQVEDKFYMSEKDREKRIEQLMKDHNILREDAEALLMKEFNETVERNVEELMEKDPKIKQRVEEKFMKNMKELPEYQDVERKVERDLRRSQRLPSDASDVEVKKAVDVEMRKMLDKELDVIKQEKTVATRRGLSGDEAEVFELKHLHGELRKAFDGSVENLPLSIDNRRGMVISADANVAKEAIGTARNADEIRAVLNKRGIIPADLEDACMKAYGVSREEARNQMSRLDVHKRSAELAVEGRRERLLNRQGVDEAITRGVKLIGLSLTPAGLIITAKVIAEGKQPFVRGLQRAGLVFRTRMEGRRGGRWMVTKWDASKRRAGRQVGAAIAWADRRSRGPRMKVGKAVKAMRTRRLEKELANKLASLGATNPALSARLTDTYRRTNDLSGVKTSLKGWYRNKYPDMLIDEVNRNVSDFIKRYDPDRKIGLGQSLRNVGNKLDTYFFEIGGKELQIALTNRFKALDVSSDPKKAAINAKKAAKDVVKKYRETGNVSEIEVKLREAYIGKYPNMPIDEVNRNVSDFIKSISVEGTYTPELKKVSLLTGGKEDIRRTRGWKAAYHSGLSLIVPFYPSALVYDALRGLRGLTGEELRAIALYSTESGIWKKSKKVGKKIKESKPGKAIGKAAGLIGEGAGVYAEIGRDVADAGRRGVAAVKRVPKAVGSEVREATTERLKEMRTRRLEKELAKEFGNLGALDPDGVANDLVSEYRNTNDLAEAKKNLSGRYQAHLNISVYEADIKAARFLEVRDPERVREPIRAKWKEGLVKRDLNRMEKELSTEFTNRGVTNAEQTAKDLVTDYGKSNDMWQITQALKSNGARNRIGYFKERYSPEKLGEPLRKRPGSSFKRAAEKIVSMEEKTFKEVRLSLMDDGLTSEFNRLHVPAADNSVREIRKLVKNYGADTTDTNFTKVRDKLVEFYRDRGSSFDDAGAEAYMVLRYYSPDNISKPGPVDLRGRAQWVREHKGGIAKTVGLSLVAAPVYVPYKASRGVYAGYNRAKTMRTLGRIDHITAGEANRYRRLEDAMISGGVPREEARVLIDDHMHNKNKEISATPPGTPRKSNLEYHNNLQKEAKALVVTHRTMGGRYRELTKDFFKPFKHNKTLDEVIQRGGLYSEHGENDPKLIDIRNRAVADIAGGVDSEQIILRANREVDDHLIESGAFNKYLKDNIRKKYGVLGSEIDNINSHLMDGRRDKITEVRRQMGTIAEPSVNKKNLVNAQVLVDAHRSVQEIASVEAVNMMKPSVQEQCLDFLGGERGVKEVRLLTKEEKRDIIFGLDLGSNLHARMLLEDYMGIGPRPSEFYHGIGPETREEREEEREREGASPLYSAATVGTAELFGQITGGIEELKKPSKKGEKKE